MTVPPKRKTSRKTPANPATPRKRATRARVQASPLRKVLGQNLKRAREECGLSQRALTALSGVSQRHIALIETVGANVSLDVIAALARHVDRTVAELLTPPAP